MLKKIILAFVALAACAFVPVKASEATNKAIANFERSSETAEYSRRGGSRSYRRGRSYSRSYYRPARTRYVRSYYRPSRARYTRSYYRSRPVYGSRPVYYRRY